MSAFVTSAGKQICLTTPRYGPHRTVVELWELFPDLTATLHISSSEGKSFGLTTLRQDFCRSIVGRANFSRDLATEPPS